MLPAVHTMAYPRRKIAFVLASTDQARSSVNRFDYRMVPSAVLPSFQGTGRPHIQPRQIQPLLVAPGTARWPHPLLP
jgi:hypothetical protein